MGENELCARSSAQSIGPRLDSGFTGIDRRKRRLIAAASPNLAKRNGAANPATHRIALSTAVPRATVADIAPLRAVAHPCAVRSTGEAIRRRAERRDKRIRIEERQVFRLFTHADVLDGDLKLLTDGDDHASFGRAVEFRQHDPGALHGFAKSPWPG